MRKLSFFAGTALAAWLTIAPFGSVQAQQPGPSTPGAAAGRNYNGIPSRTFGRITAGNAQNVNGTNRNNLTPAQANAAARSQAAAQNANARPLNSRASSRPNFTQNQSAQSNDARFARREARNDNDTFQTDPYQSSASSYQNGNINGYSNGYTTSYTTGGYPVYNPVPVPVWGWGWGYANGEYAGPVRDVPVDPVASGYTVATPARQGPVSVWTPRRIERSWAQHQWQNKPMHDYRTMEDVNGIPPRDMSRSSFARNQSLDRAANYVNANHGRDEESLESEVPADEAVQAAREVDQRLDPRGR